MASLTPNSCDQSVINYCFYWLAIILSSGLGNKLAREQVKHMVIDGTSSRRIRNYLHRWVVWWAMTSETWQYQEILQWFIDVCWHKNVADYATVLHQLHVKELHTRTALSVGAAA